MRCSRYTTVMVGHFTWLTELKVSIVHSQTLEDQMDISSPPQLFSYSFSSHILIHTTLEEVLSCCIETLMVHLRMLRRKRLSTTRTDNHLCSLLFGLSSLAL